VVGGSNGAISTSVKPQMAAFTDVCCLHPQYLGKFKDTARGFPATARLSCLTCFGFKRQLGDALILRAFSFILSAAAAT